ncbi:hypothetical protein [Lactiplantibacillus plantarum]|uniref:hypothetical protein n=1 Tax=Lactiplantibacillus plantarum TaxID=1590 RepID=UPI00157EFF2D|nr:hypothetical protein [Lactiplantibacillus plantarum]QRG93741.1 hypothetical protein JNO58_10470 [Lactiplantibacillus plantarum]QRG93782.1 hypothetical protein JNO58_10735 [Lactiplantibacillus plantarum]BEI64684.1 hypothetical protein IYO1511_c21690 [Lactiplantibacillus plantarum]
MKQSNKIVVYHGTTKVAGEKILKERKIIGSNIKQVRVTNTEEGYVFLSDSLAIALHYGSLKQSNNTTKPLIPFYVFKLKMNEDILDIDCFEMKKIERNGLQMRCYKVKGDVSLIDHECKYAKIDSVGVADSLYSSVNTLSQISSAYVNGSECILNNEMNNFLDGGSVAWKDC